MSENIKSKGRFKSKGAHILKSQQPRSMREFLENQDKTAIPDYPEDSGMNQVKGGQSFPDINEHSHKSTSEQIANSVSVQIHKSTNAPKEKVERIHIQLRKDLADKLLKRVFNRKQDSRLKRKEATQRAIIEEALEEYFRKQST